MKIEDIDGLLREVAFIDNFSKAERLAQWPFELIAALVLEQINK